MVYGIENDLQVGSLVVSHQTLMWYCKDIVLYTQVNINDLIIEIDT